MNPIQPLRIIIAEDDDQTRTGLRLLLEGNGHTVKAARNGSQAHVWTGDDAEEPFDLAIFDYSMPNMSGLDAILRTLEMRPSLETRFWIASSDPGDIPKDDVEKARLMAEARRVPGLEMVISKLALERTLRERGVIA